MVEYRIDRRSGVATYVQIVQQTKQALRLGLLEPGDKLPTAREVVEAVTPGFTARRAAGENLALTQNERGIIEPN